MDLLAKRYASPFFLLDQYLSMQRLDEFITEVWNIHNEEEIFQVWLHKVDTMSFDDFKTSLQPVKPVAPDEVADTIKASKDILANFNLAG